MTRETFPFEFKAWRQRLALSQSQAAAELGLSLFTIRAWEQGINAPPSPRLVRLAMERLEQCRSPSTARGSDTKPG